MFLRLNIMVTMFMAFWTVSRVFLQPENLLYRCRFTVYNGSIWWWKYLWQFGLPQGGSSFFKIVIIGVVSVSIFYIAEYHGDNIHDMLDCSKNVLAAQKLSLLLWFESLYDSMIWTQCPWEGRLSQGSKSYCWFDSPTPLDVIYD